MLSVLENKLITTLSCLVLHHEFLSFCISLQHTHNLCISFLLQNYFFLPLCTLQIIVDLQRENGEVERGVWGATKGQLAKNQTRFFSFLLHILTKLSFTHMLDVEQYYHRTICLRQVCIANKGCH